MEPIHYSRIKFRIALLKYVKENAEQRCLLEDNECSERIIQAHTIQNKVVLDKLSHDGHVYMTAFDPKLGLEFKLIGKNQATTFSGFCSFHDNKIFKLIDLELESDFDQPSMEQIVLFFFRNICMELWKKLNASRMFGHFICLIEDENLKELEKILNLDHQQGFDYKHLKTEILEPFKLGTDKAARELNPFFESCLKQLANKKYHHTVYYHRAFGFSCPIAVSSVFSPIFDFNNKEIFKDVPNGPLIHIGLTIFPFNGITHILFTTNKKNKNYFERLMGQFESMLEPNKFKLLSKIIVFNCENCVFYPPFLDSFSKSLKELIKKVFDDTILDIVPYSKYPDFSIFDN
jgi:hypothetical protein